MNVQVPRTVVVALDGTTESARVLPLARAVAAQLRAHVTAVHVAGPPSAQPAPDAVLPADIPLQVVTGGVAEGILAALESADAAMLAMTCVAAGDPDRPLGTIAEEVATKTSRPILLFRPDVDGTPGGAAHELKRLLVPVDGSRTTASALTKATALARQLGATLDVLFVAAAGVPAGPASGARYVDQPQHEWGVWQHELRQRLLVEIAGASPGADIPVHLCEGDPGDEIVRVAREGAYDAIVLVRRSKFEPGRAGVLRKVLRQAHCPLLLIGGPE